VPGTVKFTTVLPDGAAAAILIPGSEFVHDGAKEAFKRIEAGDPGVVYSPDTSAQIRIVTELLNWMKNQVELEDTLKKMSLQMGIPPEMLTPNRAIKLCEADKLGPINPESGRSG
jgi:hypothetical protein